MEERILIISNNFSLPEKEKYVFIEYSNKKLYKKEFKKEEIDYSIEYIKKLKFNDTFILLNENIKKIFIEKLESNLEELMIIPKIFTLTNKQTKINLNYTFYDYGEGNIFFQKPSNFSLLSFSFNIKIIFFSCVMFGKHKKHDVLSLKQGAIYIRKSIDNQLVKGILKKEFSEEKLLKIKENGLIMEKEKAETVKKKQKQFLKELHTLKNRKEFLIKEINNKFDEERQKIDSAENEWSYKLDLTEKLNQFLNDKNDAFVLANTKFIMDGLRKLNEKITFNELNVYNNIDTSLKVDNIQDENEQPIIQEFTLDDLIEGFSNYISIGQPNFINYKE